jgi:hypothetical protein
MLKKSKKVRMQKKDAMGESPEGMVDGGMSITRGQNKNVQAKLVTFKGVF